MLNVSLDLKDAYWHIPIRHKMRKFLFFSGRQGNLAIQSDAYRTKYSATCVYMCEDSPGQA